MGFKWCILGMLTTVSALAGGKGFTKLGFDEAMARAAKEEKLVFVDFFTTWCGPCKVLDRTTFRDEEVNQWLLDHAVAVKIDAEVETDLAKRYKITAYPTLLWLKSDGSIAHRIIGAVDRNAFMDTCKLVASGKDVVADAKAAVDQAPGDWKTRMDYARALVSVGRSDDGFDVLKHMLADREAGKLTVEPAMVVMTMTTTGSEHMRPYLTESYERLLGQLNGEAPTTAVVENYLAFAGATGHGNEVLGQYDRMKAAGADAAVLKAFHGNLFRYLLAARRYAEIQEMEPVAARLDKLREMEAKYAGTPNAANMKQYFLTQKLDLYQVAAALDQTDIRAGIAEDLLRDAPDHNAYNGLSWADYEAGKVNAQSLTWAQKALEMSGPDNAAVVDTLAHVLGVLGRRDEATALVKDAITRQTDEDSTEMGWLKECLEWLQQEQPTKPSQG